MIKIDIAKVKEIMSRYKKHQIKVFSAQMAYFLFLSIFPFIVFVMSLASRMNLDISVFITAIQSRLPYVSSSMIDELIRNYLINDSIALLIASGGFTFWSVSRSVSALMNSFNKAYGHDETRGFLRIWGTALLVTLSLIVLILVSITLPSLGKGFFEYLGNFIDFPSYAYGIFSLIRVAVSIAVYIAVILLIHAILPAGNLRARDVIYGSVFSIVGWVVITKAFNFFAALFTNYALVYGSLASIVILMIWMYLACIILMLGAEINSTIKDYRKK